MTGGLLKSTLLISANTTLSRILGLVRDVVIARYFGAGTGMDAFIVAFRIPNFLRRLFAEGGFSQAFVPVLAEYRERRTREEVQALVDHTSAILGVALFGVTVLGVLCAPVVVLVFAPGFAGDADKQELTAALLRVTFPYIFFISLTALAGGILNTYRKFGVPAFTPVFLNLSMIAAAIWLAPRMERPVESLAWGVFIAGVVQLLFQIPFLRQLHLLPRPRLGRDREGVGRILKLMMPTLFGVSVTQINLLVDTQVASFLVTGSISWLYYSDRLVEFPLGVFGIALATVIMPSLSAEHARNSTQGYAETLDWALRWVFLISLPAALGLAYLSGPALATLFQYREFSPYDVEMAAISLMAFASGLPAYVLIKILVSGTVSRQDTRTPVRAGVIALISNIIFILLLYRPLAHAGLALATAISSYINAGILYVHLQRHGGLQLQAGWSTHLLRICVALAVMLLVLQVISPPLDQWLAWPAQDRIQRLALCVAGGAVGYFAALRVTGMTLREMLGRHGTEPRP
ncbi:MAG: murein biosynthesis integral membrane protein MurJ [Gammaproteobacteria bacterium RIFCSPLOWO2_02_FULL_61_13]|nr:MAG: murein biosynthesis integral membrane protein MurJ [Gammaproteobacteria bacterium RIFCSPLOWO2_02_FULL_61_13]